MESFRIYNGGVKLFFGAGALGEAEGFLRSLLPRRVLVVMGRRSGLVSGAFGDVRGVLEGLGAEYSVYSGVPPNPGEDVVGEIAEAYGESGAEGFVAVGGGSVIDAAKAARVVVETGRGVRDYLLGRRRVFGNRVFLLAVNLTHGTGSEIDRYSVVSLRDEGLKLGFSAGYPTVSIDDPRYTVSLPRSQTIYTAMDAFAHAVESATSTISSPYTRLLAGEAVRLIVENLPVAVENPGSLEARYRLLYASMLAGIGIDHGATHMGHGLEHVLSGMKPGLPHGAGLAILYRKLVEIIYMHRPTVMARLLRPLDPGLRPVPGDAQRAREAYTGFLEKIGFRETLRDYGFDEDAAAEAASIYMSHPLFKKYHRLAGIRVTEDMVRNIYLCAL